LLELTVKYHGILAVVYTVQDGKNYTYWNHNNREMRAEVVETKNGRRIVMESGFYIARFIDANWAVPGMFHRIVV
jgi:hypothetical protein